MRKIQDANLKDQKVLVRVDFNVPMTKDGEIEGDKRIRETLPTIQYLLDHGAAEIILMTHLGKPEGKFDASLSLWPIANRLAELLNIDIKFDLMQDEYKLNKRITLLENLRFNKGEEENTPGYANGLASKGSLYVNDAFGTAHRAHASTEGVARLLPSFAGLLVQKEVTELQKLLATKEKPFTLILGGAKIADKLPTLKNLTSRADNFLIGGAIANTFLAARRHNLGKSLIEDDAFGDANAVWKNLMDSPDKNLYLPKDLVLSLSEEKEEDGHLIGVEELLKPSYEEYAVVDIGPNTINQFAAIIKESKTIFWNGNMGISEIPEFANGTKEIALAIRNLAQNKDAHIVVGGGDTVAEVESLGLASSDKIFLSTGGGATLEYLAGKELPGLKVLE